MVPLGLLNINVNLRMFLSFWWLSSIVPTVYACFMIPVLSWIQACSIVRWINSAVNGVLLSVRMVFGTYACLVKYEMGLFTTDGASGHLKEIANINHENTPTAVRMCVRPLEGENGPTESFFYRSSAPLLGS